MLDKSSAEIEFTGIILSISRNDNGEIERLIINAPYEHNNCIYSRLIDCRYLKNKLIDNAKLIQCGNIVHGSGYLDILVDSWFVLTGKANINIELPKNKHFKNSCDRYFSKNEVNNFINGLVCESKYISDGGDGYGPGCNESLNIDDIYCHDSIYQYIYEYLISKISNLHIIFYGFRINSKAIMLNRKLRYKDLFLIHLESDTENAYPLCILCSRKNSFFDPNSIYKFRCEVSGFIVDDPHGLSILQSGRYKMVSIYKSDVYKKILINIYETLKDLSYIRKNMYYGNVKKCLRGDVIMNSLSKVTNILKDMNVNIPLDVIRNEWAYSYFTIFNTGIDDIVIKVIDENDNYDDRIFVYKISKNNLFYEYTNKNCSITISENPVIFEGNFIPDNNEMIKLKLFIDTYFEELKTKNYDNLQALFTEHNHFSYISNDKLSLNVVHDTWVDPDKLLVLDKDLNLLAKIAIPSCSPNYITIIDGTLSNEQLTSVINLLNENDYDGESKVWEVFKWISCLYNKKNIDEANDSSNANLVISEGRISIKF